MSGYFTSTNGNVPSNVPINFNTNSGTAVSSGNAINIFGAGGTTVSGSGSTVTITTVTNSMTWSDQASDFLATVNQGYFCTAGLTVTLPASPSQGNTVSIICDTASQVTVQCNTGQYISIGAEVSSFQGSASSTALGDNLILVFRSVSQTWMSLEADATWSVTT